MAVFTGSRIRDNNVFGTVTDSPLSNVATTVNSAGLANLSAVSSNHAVLVLDPLRTAGAPEIVIVTAHTGSATSATISRGAYGTSARQHASGTLWVQAATIDDLIRIVTSSTRPSDQYEGQLIYETDTDKFVAHNGSAWVDAVPIGAWQAWTPTLTGITLGNGTLVARYAQIGKTIHYRIYFELGSTSAVGATPSFSLPVAHATMDIQHIIGSVAFVDANGGDYFGRVIPVTNDGHLHYLNSSAQWATPSATAPFTWTTSDEIIATGTYEAS